MSSPTFTRHGPLTVEEYLRLEEHAAVRHEYVAGEVYAMTGGTLRHNRISLNIAARLRTSATGGPCEVFINDVKVRAAADLFYYPDVVVACGPISDEDVYLREPCLIVEVTSPSPAGIDRREKLVAYRQIATLRAYFIVDQARRRVEIHSSDATGEWQRAQVAGEGSIDVPCPAAALSLDVVYEGVALAAVGEPAPVGYEA